MYLPYADWLDLFRPYVRGVDAPNERGGFVAYPDHDLFRAMTEQAKRTEWRDLPSASVGDYEQPGHRQVTAMLGKSKSAILLAQNIFGRCEFTAAAWNRLARTNGTKHVVWVENLQPSLTDADRLTSFTLTIHVQEQRWSVEYQYGETLKTSGSDRSRAEAVVRLVEARRTMRALQEQCPPYAILDASRQRIAQARLSIAEAFAKPAPDADQLEPFLRANGFSRQDTQDVCEGRVPNRLSLPSSWTVLMNESGGFTVERDESAVPFLREPPSDAKQDAWLAKSAVIANRASALGADIWNHREALLAASIPISA